MSELCLKRCALLAAGKGYVVLRDTSCKGWLTGTRRFGHHADKKEEITLVEELKMRFRTKAIGKEDLTKISIEDIREIWVDTLVTQQGLGTTKIFLDPILFKEMEIRLREVFQEWPEDATVEFEDYLPTMVDLIRPNVSRTDQLEVANELFDVYFPDYSGNPVVPSDINGRSDSHLKLKIGLSTKSLGPGKTWQPKPQAMLQNLKIKSCYRVVPGKSNIEIMKNIEENESHNVHENGNVFSLWEFVMKMVNPPIIRGIGA